MAHFSSFVLIAIHNYIPTKSKSCTKRNTAVHCTVCCYATSQDCSNLFFCGWNVHALPVLNVSFIQYNKRCVCVCVCVCVCLLVAATNLQKIKAKV